MNKKIIIIGFFIFVFIFILNSFYFFKRECYKVDLKKRYVENNVTNSFNLLIKQSIEKKQDYYKKGDKVLLKIEVINPELFNVNNVVLNINNSGVSFLPGEGYTLDENRKIKINFIKARETFIVYGIYNVKSNDIKSITSEISIKTADSVNNLILAKNENIKSTLTFKVGSAILKIVNKEENNQAKNAVFGLYKDSKCQELVAAGEVFENLDVNSIYYLKEISPPDNCVIYKDILAVLVDSDGKIQLKKYIENENVQYRAINSSIESPTINKEGTAILTLSRTAINILPNLRGQSNLYYVLIGTILIIGSICSYIIYLNRKKEF